MKPYNGKMKQKSSAWKVFALLLALFIVQEAFAQHTAAASGGTVLIFSPHPDDGDIFAGGSTLVHVNELGDMVVEVYMTSGDAGEDATREGRTGQELAAAREAEAEKAAHMLGISEVIFLRFPDRGLTRNETSLWAVRDIVERYQPYMVYTSEYINAQYHHPDHLATGLIVHDAVESLNLREKPIIRYFDYWVNPDNANVFVDVTGHLVAKRRALMCYETQLDIDIMQPALPLLRLRAIYAGYALLAGMPGRFFEGFRQD